jgi:hypothetical protein
MKIFETSFENSLKFLFYWAYLNVKIFFLCKNSKLSFLTTKKQYRRVLVTCSCTKLVLMTACSTKFSTAVLYSVLVDLDIHYTAYSTVDQVCARVLSSSKISILS